MPAKTYTSGEVLTAAMMNTYTSNSAASVYLTSASSIPNITDSVVTWSSAEYDTDSMFSAGSATRLTCKTAGIYIVTFTLAWPNNSTGERIGWIQKNGSTADRWGMVRMSPSTTGETIQTAAAQMSLVVNDYIQIGVYQSSGGALNLNGTGTARTRFSAGRISAT